MKGQKEEPPGTKGKFNFNHIGKSAIKRIRMAYGAIIRLSLKAAIKLITTDSVRIVWVISRLGGMYCKRDASDVLILAIVQQQA